MDFKFNIGDKVHLIADDKDNLIEREVLDIRYSSQKGVIYQLSALQVDIRREKVTQGVLYAKEDEIELIKLKQS